MSCDALFCRSLAARVTIEEPSANDDTIGGVGKSWAVLAQDVPASIVHRDGSESTESGKLISEAVTFFTVRHRSDLDAGQRVLYDGRYYDVVSVVPDPPERPRQSRLKTIRSDD